MQVFTSIAVAAVAGCGPEIAGHAGFRGSGGVGEGAPGWLAPAQVGGLAGSGGDDFVEVAAFFCCEAAAFAGCPEPLYT